MSGKNAVEATALGTLRGLRQQARLTILKMYKSGFAQVRVLDF